MRKQLVAFLLLASLAWPAQRAQLAEKVRHGNQLMAAGQYAQAAAVYAELRRVLPNDPGILTNLGIAYHMLGKEREAIRQFTAALKIQPGILPAMVMLGAAYVAAGQPARALKPLRAVMREQPDMKEVREPLAEALVALGRYEEAAVHFRWLVAADPSSARDWYALGHTYKMLAAKAFRQLEKTAPESGYMLDLVARAQAAKGRNRSAFYLYRQALARQPELPDVHGAIAAIYRRTGHADWAAEELARQRRAPAPGCQEHPLACEFHRGHYRRLIRLAKQKHTAEAYYWQSRAYEALAQQAFSRLAQLPPSVERHALLAGIDQDNERYAEAVKHWRAALKLSPGNPVLERKLAIALRLKQNYRAAGPLVRKLLRHDPDSVELNYLLGQILLNQHLPAKAIPYLEKAARRAPAFLPGRSSLGLAYLENHEPAKAIPHLEAALPTDRDGSLHFRLARAYRAAGRREQAKRTLAQYQALRKAYEAEQRNLGKDLEITPP